MTKPVSPVDDRGLSSKTFFITGAGSGIGRAIAQALALAGANLALLDLDLDQVESVARPIRERGGRITCHPGDVTRLAEVMRAVEEAGHHHGALDGGVNSAGILGRSAKLLDYPDDDFRKVIDVNVLGVVNSMKAELSLMTAQGYGSIVNIASAAGIIGWAEHSAYVTSKHAVVGLTKSAGLDYAAAGIRINSVCPAFIYTPMTDGLFEQKNVHEAAVGSHPIGRLGEASEVAEAVMWLLSSRSSFAVGSNLVLDGGSTVD